MLKLPAWSLPAVTLNGVCRARAPGKAADRTVRPGCTPTAVVDQSPSGWRLTLHSAMSARPLASSDTRQNQPSISVSCDGSGLPYGTSAPVRRYRWIRLGAI